jgi:hypothetical protein
MDAIRLLSTSVTPVVLISACGLVTLALYNRLNAILLRLRAFHQQKIELLRNPEAGGDQPSVLDLIDSQIRKVTGKARAVQKGLYCLLGAVLAFLLCSLLAGLAVLHESLGLAALGTHVLGVSLFFVGTGWAIRELTLSLTPLEEESAYLEVLTGQHLARTQGVPKVKRAKTA